MKGDRMGEDYGVVRKVGHHHEVEVFGATPGERHRYAAEAFVCQLHIETDNFRIESLGTDKLDFMVERFKYAGSR